MIFQRKQKKAEADKWMFFMPPRDNAVTVQQPFDVYLFFTTLMLILIGVLMIFSSSAILAQEKYGDTYYFLKKELVFFTIGLGALFLARRIPYKSYEKWIYPLLGLNLLMLVLCLVPPFGYTAGGASRWIKLGSFTLQPSEITKILVVFFVAYMIAKKKEKMISFAKGFLPTMAIAGIFLAVILAQKDLGSAFVLGSVIMIMLFVSQTRSLYLISSLLLASPALYYLIFSVSFRKRRILAFLDPWKYKMDYAFQIIQSFVAFKSGGLAGSGLGESKQKLFYLPEAHTDFIFSVLGEEFGMIGVIVVASLFLFFIFRGFRIANKTTDPFGMFLALGITSLIGLQAFINFGVVMGLLPTKGLVLPFISYGGSSLVISMFAVGVLLNVSTQTGEEVE
ncbi:MAG TPA: putative lipid II flippase FtsW [bacterium]|nr:putative lipid II flippase FtsW [bacterium]